MTANGRLHILRIEVDGHYHGSSDVPRPWVAEIGAPCPRFGLQRSFVKPMNDWKDARRAWSGNLYGVVATFALREGRMYEVSRLRGKSSKRHVAREFLRIADGKRVAMTPEEALAHADGGGEATILCVAESMQTWVAELRGLGTPQRLGFVLVAGERRYRVREGQVYEIVEDGRQRLVGVRAAAVATLSETEAISWLQQR